MMDLICRNGDMTSIILQKSLVSAYTYLGKRVADPNHQLNKPFLRFTVSGQTNHPHDRLLKEANILNTEPVLTGTVFKLYASLTKHSLQLAAKQNLATPAEW